MDHQLAFSNLRRTAGKLFAHVGIRYSGKNPDLSGFNAQSYEVVTFLNQPLSGGVNSIAKTILKEGTVEAIAELYRHAHTLGYLKCDLVAMANYRGFGKESFFVFFHEDNFSKKIYLDWVIMEVSCRWGTNIPCGLVTDAQYASDRKVNQKDLKDIDELSLYYQLRSFGVDVFQGRVGSDTVFLIG